MRVPHLADVLVVARALLAVPEAARPRALRGIVQRAEMGGLWARAMGHAHPRYGDGSLMCAAFAGPCPPERPISDPEYRAAVMLVLEALGAYPFAQDTHLGTVGSRSRRAGAIASPQSSQ